MFNDICFYNFSSKEICLFPKLEYAESTIKESAVRTIVMNGKQQLSLIRREKNNIKQIFVIFNYNYNSSESFGLCLVFRDYYPKGIGYLFSLMSGVISNIIDEGKVLFVDPPTGIVYSSRNGIKKNTAVLKYHLDFIRKKFNNAQAKLTEVSTLSSNYYGIPLNQSIIQHLSDASWNIEDSLKYNNVVIVSEADELVNVRRFVNVYKEQERKIKALEEKLRKSEEANEKQNNGHSAESFDRQKEIGTKKETPDRTGPNPPVKPVKKKRNKDWGVGIVSFLILFSLIVPWFIPGLLPKLAVALTGVAVVLLILVIFDVFTDSDNIIFYVCLLAILLSSLMTGYGLIWGFPSFNNGKHEQGTNVNVPEKTEKNAWHEAKQINTIDAYKIFVESNGQSKYVEDALFKIVRFARANNNTLGLSYVINYEDSCRVNDCLPYDTTSTPGAEARDSVVSLCKIWVSSASNLKKRISKYSFDRDYSNEKEQEYLGKMVKDALALDSIWSLIDNEFNICDMQKNKCHYNVYEINGAIDSVFSSLIMAQEILTIGKSKLADGERYATDENKSFYKQAIKCVYKYFDERHYSGMEVINDCMLYEKSY